MWKIKVQKKKSAFFFRSFAPLQKFDIYIERETLFAIFWPVCPWNIMGNPNFGGSFLPPSGAYPLCQILATHFVVNLHMEAKTHLESEFKTTACFMLLRISKLQITQILKSNSAHVFTSIKLCTSYVHLTQEKVAETSREVR